MKLILLAAAVAFVLPVLVLGQSAKQIKLEQEIRKLDAAEADAILNKDIAALDKITAEDLTVNAPGNTVIMGRKAVTELIQNGVIDYSSFVREIQTILFYGDTVIVMGSETIKPVRKAPFAGQTVRRRFTNFWMKRKGKWLLSARHASVICPN